MAEENEQKTDDTSIAEIEIPVMDLLDQGVEVDSGTETHIIIDTGGFTFSN